MNEWIWWASVDVAGLSTFITLLLLIATCMNCSTSPPAPQKDILKTNNTAYNKLDDKSIIENALNKFPKPKPPPVPPLRPLPTLPQKKVRDPFNQTEEEIFPSSARNRVLNQPAPS